MLQVSYHQVRIIADDLAGVEQVRWVEGILDFAEDLDELAILPGKELGPRQAAALRCRDRPTGFDYQVINLPDQRLEPGSVAGIGQVEEGRRRIRPSPA